MNGLNQTFQFQRYGFLKISFMIISFTFRAKNYSHSYTNSKNQLLTSSINLVSRVNIVILVVIYQRLIIKQRQIPSVAIIIVKFSMLILVSLSFHHKYNKIYYLFLSCKDFGLRHTNLSTRKNNTTLKRSSQYLWH